MKIWEQKRKHREDQIDQLIRELHTIKDNHAQTLISALTYYGKDGHGMPHQDWVKLRKELIQKTEQFIGLMKGGQND